MSTEEQKETFADKAKAQIDALKTKEGRAALKDKAKEGFASAATTAKEQFDAFKTKEGRDALKNKAKENAAAYMHAIREKAPGYWKTLRARTVNLWNNGTKGKAACIGIGAGVLLLGCLVFGGKSNDEKRSETPGQLQAESTRSTTDGKTKSETMRMESSKKELEQQERIAMAQAVQADMEKGWLKDEEIADSDEHAEYILKDTFLWGTQLSYYKPQKKVSYKEFTKIYYMIEDAFLPEFVSSLPKALHSEKGCSPSLALKLSRDIVSRANHLLYYCCRTGLAPDATGKEKSNYVKLLKLAMMEKKMLGSYSTMGRSNAESEFKAFCTLRNTLPKHEPATDAEQRYATLPYPSHYIDVESEASSSVDQNAKDFEHNIDGSWPAEARDKNTPRLKELVKTRAELAQKKWHPIAIGNFPIKTFCGLEFGQTIATCEKVLGAALGPVYENQPDGFAAYLLKKPFRKFTRACLRFVTDEPGYEGNKKKEPYFQALRSIQLEADISEDINYDSCLEELARVKKLLEEKYMLDLGKGVACDHYSGKGFWYGAGLDTGWIVLGIRPTTDGQSGRAKGGNKTMVLEVRCADARSMQDWVNVARKELDDKQKSETEAKKEKLNISADAGADVL